MGIFSLSPTIIGILVITTIVLMFVAVFIKAQYGLIEIPAAIFIAGLIGLMVLLLTWWTNNDWTSPSSAVVILASVMLLAVAGLLASYFILDD